MRFYFDTSIWLDYYEKRGENGSVALKLIKKIIEKDWCVLYSDAIIKEFKNLDYNIFEINNIFSIVKTGNLIKTHVFREQIDFANKLSANRKVPKMDALHAILARDNNSYLISKDHHFLVLKDIVICKQPEDFI